MNGGGIALDRAHTALLGPAGLDEAAIGRALGELAGGGADLDRYFPDGIDTPGVVMIRVHAERIRYWDGEDEGEIAA